MTEAKITYHIKESNGLERKIELSEESRKQLNAEQLQKIDDLGTSIVNSILTGMEKGTDAVFKYAGVPEAVKAAHNIKINALTIPIDYAIYLMDERAKYGDNGIRAHIVVASQTLVGPAFTFMVGIDLKA